MSALEYLDQFHFIRPLLLLLLLPAVVLFAVLLKRKLHAGQWQQVIDEALIPHVLDRVPQKNDQGSLWLVLLTWLLATLALAGPSWEKIPTPVKKSQDALVIMLDMSLSMGAQDIKPDRATRAIQKVTDIIRGRRDGLTALLTYSGEAHTVTPLTDDRDTIENLLPALSPFIMPKPGSRPDKAIALAQQLVTDAGIANAQLLLITDGIIDKDVNRIKSVLDKQRFDLSLLTLGTAEGAPISLPNSGFLRDGEGNIVLPKFDLEPIRKLVSTLSLNWQSMRYDDQDWQPLLNSTIPSTTDSADAAGNGQQHYDQWYDQGYWLVFLLLPMSLILFRRGVLFSWMVIPLCSVSLLEPTKVYAEETPVVESPSVTGPSIWQNLWQTPDQQAAELLKTDPASAANRFENSNWQGVAAYQAGDFETAGEAFRKDSSIQGRYNYANALAQSGQLQAAIETYNQVLEQQPDFDDARYNKQIVEQALAQQQKQEQKQEQEQEQNQQHKPDSSQNNDDSHSQENSDQQNSEQQSSEQQSQNAQSSDSSGQSQHQEQQTTQQQAQSSNSSDNSTDRNRPADSKEDQTFAEQKAQQLSEQTKAQASNESQEEADQGKEVQQQQAPNANEAQPSSGEDLTSAAAPTPTQPDFNREEQAAMQQWLNRIPDNPGNLLQRKFLYQYRQQTGNQADQQEEVLW